MSRLTEEQKAMVEANLDLIDVAMNHHKLRWARRFLGKEETRSICAEGLCKGVLCFNPAMGNFRTWAFGAMSLNAQNEVAKLNATKRGRGRNVSLQKIEIAAEYGERDAQSLASSELVSKILSRLNPRQAEMVKLYFLDGLSGPEIGAKLGRTKALVSYTLIKALNKLRDDKQVGALAELFNFRNRESRVG